MSITNKQMEEVIATEIQWCLDNPSKNLSEQYQVGFIKGIKQARLILRGIIK